MSELKGCVHVLPDSGKDKIRHLISMECKCSPIMVDGIVVHLTSSREEAHTMKDTMIILEGEAFDSDGSRIEAYRTAEKLILRTRWESGQKIDSEYSYIFETLSGDYNLILTDSEIHSLLIDATHEIVKAKQENRFDFIDHNRYG